MGCPRQEPYRLGISKGRGQRPGGANTRFAFAGTNRHGASASVMRPAAGRGWASLKYFSGTWETSARRSMRLIGSAPGATPSVPSTSPQETGARTARIVFCRLVQRTVAGLTRAVNIRLQRFTAGAAKEIMSKAESREIAKEQGRR